MKVGDTVTIKGQIVRIDKGVKPPLVGISLPCMGKNHVVHFQSGFEVDTLAKPADKPAVDWKAKRSDAPPVDEKAKP
jgi:hypothetical protein